jgi:hypothetical protein
MLPCALLVVALLAGHAKGVCESVYPYALDVAFYWAKPTEGDATGVMWERSCIDGPDGVQLAAAFVPSRPSRVLVHGLQPAMLQRGTRFALGGDLDEIARMYLDAGINVGAFLWDQFGNNDVVSFIKTEDQIYTTQGFNDMGYVIKTRRGALRMLDARLDMTIPDYFVAQWEAHFPDGHEYGAVEVIGHSLGTQVVLRAAYLLYTARAIAKKPDAVTLLDAVMSPSYKFFFAASPCGHTISANMGCMARDLNADYGVPLRYFKSSMINKCIFSAREDVDIIRYTAFAIVKLHMFGMHPLGSCWDNRLLSHIDKFDKYIDRLGYQMTMQHTYVVPYYLLTFFSPPRLCVPWDAGGYMRCNATDSLSLGARTAPADVLAWSRAPTDGEPKLCFHQFDEHGIPGQPRDEGPTMTLDPADDLYFLKPCPGTST